MKKFYLFTLLLIGTVCSAFAQLTVTPNSVTEYNPQGTEWYRILFVPEAGGTPQALTATANDNATILIQNELEDITTTGADNQLWQLVSANDGGYSLVSKSGIYAYVDVSGFALKGAKIKTEQSVYLKLVDSKKPAYNNLATKQLQYGTYKYYLSPKGAECAVANTLTYSVVFRKVTLGAKECTLSYEASGYEAGKAKVVFEGATDGKVGEGEKVTLKISNESDQFAYFKSIKVNGEELLEANLFEDTFEKELNITVDTKVEIVFFQPEELIVSYPNGGEADVEIKNAKFISEGTYYAPLGEEVELKVTPKDGYKLISIEPSEKFTLTKKTFVKIRLKALKESTAVEAIQGLSYQVYPNPATDVVEVEGLAPNAAVQLLDLTGNVVLGTKAGFDGRVALQVAQLPKGLYLLRSDKGLVKLQVK